MANEELNSELRELRCNDCAFTAGTDANSCEPTRILSRLCAEIPEPFHCHLREGLCAGWAELANKLNAQGYYDKQPDWQRSLKQELCEVIRRAHKADQRGEKFDTMQEIEEALQRVTA